MDNTWSKATPAERKRFLAWLKARSGSDAGAASAPIAVNRYLQPAAKARIKVIMARRGMKMGEVMTEMGFKTLDGSLGNALTVKGKRLRPAVLAALETWLKANEGV